MRILHLLRRLPSCHQGTKENTRSDCVDGAALKLVQRVIVGAGFPPPFRPLLDGCRGYGTIVLRCVLDTVYVLFHCRCPMVPPLTS
jgi:hypothetical protein